jgi:hypothetical protein
MGAANAALFFDALKKNPRAWNLSTHTDEEFAAARAFMSSNGHAGYMISPDVDLQNLFKNPGGVPGIGAEAVQRAITQGARTLDCYDDFLPAFYEEHGFVVSGRMKFVDEHAPDGWDHASEGRPDVVFMAYAPGRKLPERYYTDWDEAKAASRAAVQEPVAGALDDIKAGLRANEGLASGIPIPHIPAQERQARILRYRRATTQMPLSPSMITGTGQRLLDRFTERLAGHVDTLREADSVLARGAGKALTPPSARGRLPKQAGLRVKQEGRRRQALRRSVLPGAENPAVSVSTGQTREASRWSTNGSWRTLSRSMITGSSRSRSGTGHRRRSSSSGSGPARTSRRSTGCSAPSGRSSG